MTKAAGYFPKLIRPGPKILISHTPHQVGHVGDQELMDNINIIKKFLILKNQSSDKE